MPTPFTPMPTDPTISSEPLPGPIDVAFSGCFADTDTDRIMELAKEDPLMSVEVSEGQKWWGDFNRSG